MYDRAYEGTGYVEQQGFEQPNPTQEDEAATME